MFWDCTPRQLAIHFKAAGRRFQRENRAALSQAWHTAALYRTKEMPKLGELIDGPKKQTIDDMRNIALMYTRMLGGTVTRRAA